MKIIILTSSAEGIAAQALPLLHKEKEIEISMVVLSHGSVTNKKRHYFKKLKKIFKIGIAGALNGIRMRRWFNEDTAEYLPEINIEVFCKQNNIRFEETPAINNDITRKLFNEAGAALGISLGNSFIAKSVFSICPLGMINIHGEILPDYQNAQSIIWQLHNGSSQTGFTIHKINKNIDCGDILYHERFFINFKETLRQTVAFNCVEITNKACKALVEVIKNFEFYNTNAKPQGKGSHYTTPNWRQFNKIKKQFSLLKNKYG